MDETAMYFEQSSTSIVIRDLRRQFSIRAGHGTSKRLNLCIAGAFY
eukprot:IDg8993t1